MRLEHRIRQPSLFPPYKGRVEWILVHEGVHFVYDLVFASDVLIDSPHFLKGFLSDGRQQFCRVFVVTLQLLELLSFSIDPLLGFI